MPRIHLPEPDIDAPEDAAAEAPSAGATADEPKPQKRTPRGSRGGRSRKRPSEDGAAAAQEARVPNGDGRDPSEWEYVPMSEWADDLER